MKIVINKPIEVDEDIIICAIRFDIEIQAKIISRLGSVLILGKNLTHNSTIIAKKEVMICGAKLTHTTKTSVVSAEEMICIGHGDFPVVDGLEISLNAFKGLEFQKD